MRPFLVLVALLIGWAVPSSAGGSAGVTYHGRLVAPGGRPVEASNVRFRLQVRSPGSENCLLYQETHTRDMSGTQGVFSITINDGTASSVNTEPFSLDRVFQNRGTFSFAAGKCAVGSTYAPNPADGRRLTVEFDDGTFGGDWERLPSQEINFVPMAMESLSVGGYGQESLLRVHDGSGLPASVPALTSVEYDSFLGLLAGSSSAYLTPASALNGANLSAGSVDDAKLAGGISGSKISGDLSGRATGFTGALGGDVTGGQSATVVERIQGRVVDAAAPADGQVLKWSALHDRWEPGADADGAGLAVQTDDPRLSDGRAPVGTAGGDLAGDYPGPAVARIRGVAVATTGPTTAGQVLRYDGTGQYAPASLGISDIANLSTLLGNKLDQSQMPSGCAANQTLSFVSVTGSWSCSNVAGLTAASVTSGVFDVARLGTGSADVAKYLRGDGTWAAVPPGADDMGDHVATRNIVLGSNWLSGDGDDEGLRIDGAGRIGIGTASPERALHVNGSIRIEGTPLPGSPEIGDVAVDSDDSNKLKYYDGTAWREAGGGGGGVNVSPAGMIGAFPTASCPAGWLPADGSAVSRATYASLFAAIGTMYGAGDGSTTFALPDYRGFFLRGWANGSTADPDRSSRTNRGDGTTGDNVGTKQADGFRSHSHAYTDYYNTSSYGGGFGDWPATMGSGSSGRTSGATGGNETRPANISVVYCVSTATNSATTVASLGSGAANKLAMWSSSTELADSPVSVSGGSIGIGTGTPQSALDVNGAVKIGNDSACNASKAGSIRWTGSAFEGCNGTAWIGLSGAAVPAGTQCGKRYLYCSGGAPVYDTNGYSASSNSPCQGNSLTATCGVVGGYWSITGVGGCPPGYTGRHFHAGLDGSQSNYGYHISCEKN